MTIQSPITPEQASTSRTAPAAGDIESFINEYYAAWHGTDEDRIMAYYSENVTVQIPGTLMQGQTAVREQFVRPYITGFPGNRHLVKHMIFGQDEVTVEFTFDAQHTGPFAGRAATDAHVQVAGCAVYQYDLAARQITTARIYFDVATLLKQLLDPSYPHPITDEAKVLPTATMAAATEHLDLTTVIEVSQAVSGETVVERLLDTLMRTAVRHAGAERALLILSREAGERIAAEATTHHDTVVVRACDEPVTGALLPETILRYVLRTRENVILDDAVALSPFSTDPYVVQQRARSVFCLPLTNQAKLIGALYLENNRAPRVLAPARTAVLKLLASQAAISIENSRLYRDLAQREAKVRRLVDANIIGIFTWHSDGRVFDANEEFLRIIGYSRDDLASRGLRWTDFTLPEWRERDARVMEELKRGEAVQAQERELLRKDGGRVPVLTGGTLFDGTPDEGVAFVVDLTERKRAEVAIRASERSLKLITDTIPALAWSARPDGSADFFNQHYLDFIGLSEEQARGWGWTAAVHPDDLNGLAETWQRLLTSEVPGDAEARLRRRDGSYRWFLFRASPLRDEHGTIVKWYGINTDIEDRKQAEAELRQAYDSFTDAQRLSHTGSFITDLVGDDHNWSEEAFRIFGFEPGTRVSVQRIRDIIHPDDLPSFESVIARGMQGENVTFSFRIVTVTGAVKHVRGVAHVIEHVAGRPLFVGALQDVTESKVAEEALDRARSELTHVARVTAVSAFAASVAHEVNQPLSGILTNAGTCLRMLAAVPPDVAGARETANRTLRDGNRAAEVITRLRALFSKREFTLEPLHMNEIAREVVALSQSDLQRNRVVLQSEFARDLPPVTGDRIQLQQVILNLLRNASDAMVSVQDRPRHLVISTEPDADNRVRVSVRDTGVGLDVHGIHKLFDAFYTTKADGMGIGLSVSRSIIERHHGRLWAEPNDGPGATFSFAIPAAAENLASGVDTKV